VPGVVTVTDVDVAACAPAGATATNPIAPATSPDSKRALTVARRNLTRIGVLRTARIGLPWLSTQKGTQDKLKRDGDADIIHIDERREVNRARDGPRGPNVDAEININASRVDETAARG